MHRNGRLRAWALLPYVVVMICLAGAGNASAQGSATLTGTVVDNVGVIPGAVVTVTMPATGAVRTTTSNEIGIFRVAALLPGRYVVKVEVSGFKPVTVEEFGLLAADARDLGKLVMMPGGLAEAVTVTADVTPVQVATSARQAGITSDQLNNIQMKGRDIYGFLSIIPGIQDTNLSRDFTDWNSAKLVTINGSPVNNKNVMIDGIAVVDEGGTGNAFVNPNMDAVGEVQVIANGFTAENGRSNGGLVNFVTKSGSTTFKGSGWYNARRDKWNANDYVRIRNSQAKPLYRVNIGGFSIGGPVIIPKVLDSRTAKRKVFFFFSQEYTDDARNSVTSTANYPTALERVGNFSETRITNGTIQPIIDNRTGLPFPGNIIPQDRINSVGQRLLNLMPMPNGYVNPVAGQAYTANFIYDKTPLHNRVDHVFRTDGTITPNIRMSAKFLADHEDNILFSQFGPGVGSANNFVPGWLTSTTVTYVINPTTVNEINGGFAINHYGFRGGTDPYDYEQYYCANLGVCAPRLQPFGPYNAPPQRCCAMKQQDQYPYVAITSYGGGNRTNLAGYSPGAVNGRVMPTANRNHRWTFSNDLTKSKTRHTFKFGVYLELDSKTEPGTTNYMGNYNFGSVNTNPLDSGNGYANALLGVFQTYTESTVRVDKDVRHWQNEAYAQDTWKVSPGFTLDYGVRFTHSGAYYEVNHMTAAFYPELYDASKAPRLYRAVCSNGAPGNVACPTANRFAVDPANPSVLQSFALVGSFVPGTGDQLNGMRADGRNHNGNYFDYPFLVAAPRIGMAWDLRGDGRSALRASAGVFYNFPRGGQAQFVGAPPVSFNNVVRNATIDDIANFSTGKLNFQASPISSSIATLEGKNYDLPIAYNANVTYQRDIGFKTVVEAAYVGNFTRKDIRTVQLEVLPLFVFADPANQFNQTAISANYLRKQFPGMGNISDTVNDTNSLSYHAAQFSVQRRLSEGLQMGMAYTLARGMGMRGYDEYTADPNIVMNNVGGTAVRGGKEALKARYWGPTEIDRTHNLVVNYSYQIPNPTANLPILKYVLGDWQVSGVTKFLSGTSVNPSCSTTTAGIANTDPTYTGVGARCTLTGQPINAGVRVDPDPSNPDPLAAMYFNPAAFALTQPISSTIGNFGNAPLGLLRNPSISTWDLTLARRFAVPRISRGAALRVQFQSYNFFNQVKFTTMNTNLTFTGPNNATLNSPNTGRYSNVIRPREFGITARLDF